MESVVLEEKKGVFIPSFDGIRGFGVICVLTAHCFPFINPFQIGWIAMDFFFVLSGFLITGILVDTVEKKNYLKNYLGRRILRVFPLYYLFLIIMFIIVPFGFPKLLDQYGYLESHQIWFWFYSQNWLFSIEGFPHKLYMSHLWSMAVEEQFYIFWPFLVWLLRGKKLIYFCLAAIPFAILFRTFGGRLGYVFPFQYVNTLARMDSLLIGALVFLILRHYKSLLVKIALPLFILSLVTFLTIVAILKATYFAKLVPAYTIVDLLGASCIIFCLSNTNNWIKSFFSLPPFTYLGKFSYGTYIFHYPLYLVLYEHYALTASFGIKVLVGIIAIVISFLLAWLSFYYFETPFLKLKKYFVNKVEMPQKNTMAYE
jgi:peptidoglycan/LPS O-acetylase OafA/YrhL